MFGEIVDGEMVLGDSGAMVETVWDELPNRFSNIDLDTFIIMPNHIHGIIDFCRWAPLVGAHPENVAQHGNGKHPENGNHGATTNRATTNRATTRVAPTLGDIVGAFKSLVTVEYIRGVKQSGWTRFDGKLWQRNYYEHIIRNENELNRIRQYIMNNPSRWDLDRENPVVGVRRAVSQQQRDELWKT